MKERTTIYWQFLLSMFVQLQYNNIGNNRKWHTFMHMRKVFWLSTEKKREVLNEGLCAEKGRNCVRWGLFCTSIDSIRDCDGPSLKSTIKFQSNSKIIMWSGIRGVATQSTAVSSRCRRTTCDDGDSGSNNRKLAEKGAFTSTGNRYLIGSIEFHSVVLLMQNHQSMRTPSNRYFASSIRSPIFFLLLLLLLLLFCCAQHGKTLDHTVIQYKFTLPMTWHTHTHIHTQ